MLLIWIPIGIALYYLLTNNTKMTQTPSSPAARSTVKTAKDVLNERYVNGEIDEEEYKKIKKNISE